MERNLLLAIVLSMGVYIAWFAWMEKNAPARTAAPAGVATTATPGTPPPAGTPAAAPAPESLVPVQAIGAQAGLNPMGAALSSYEFQGPLAKIQHVDAPAPGF